MNKTYKYRIYPNDEQKQIIAKTFGCCRFVYNYYLDKRIKIYNESKKTFNYCDCAKDLTSLKSDKLWLREVDSTALQSSLKNLETAYMNFFREHKGFPKFKSKKTNKFSYTTKNCNNTIEYLGRHIKIPKLGKVKTKNRLVPAGKILNATISQLPSGKYYASLCCKDCEIQTIETTGECIGIDLGIKDLVITSNGDKFDNIRLLKKYEKKLTREQRKLSRKQIGSNNRNKQRVKVALIHEKIHNTRLDYLHKISHKLIYENQVIVSEDLAVSNMVKNHKLAKSISDCSWGEFIRQLSYKSEWHSRQYIKIGRFTKSSQPCNICGYINTNTKDLSVREWECPVCHTHHDRDINAAINILNEGLKLL